MSPVLLVAMAGLVLLPMLFALVFASRGALSGDPIAFLVQRYDQLVCALATPIIALLLGTSAFSAEIEDGTLLYLVTTTTPRWWIACVRVLFASVGTALLSALAVWGTGMVATGSHDPAGISRAFIVASAFGGASYAALFTLLSLLTKRALVGGLVYVLFWEGILSSTFPALHYLSVHQWMRAIAGQLTDAKSPVLTSGPSVSFSLTAALVIAVASVFVGGRMLRRPRLSRMGT
jgi:ABC-2 type transport system permease protein